MDYLNIIWILLISLGINYFFFIFAWIFKSDVFTDITYALSFSSISIIFFAWQQNFNLNQILIFLIINLWAIRLGTYLFIRILKIKIDHRFDSMRNSFWKFGAFWTFQALTVFITILPGAMFLTIDDNLLFKNETNLFSLILLISLFGLIFETIGDLQKNIFYKKMANKETEKKFIDYGLWKITRHPNYFGETLVWYGIAICFISSFLYNSKESIDYISLLFLLFPLYLNISLIYISGIKLLERKEMEKFKDSKEYKEYLKKTSMLLPFLGKKGLLNILKKEKPDFKI